MNNWMHGLSIRMRLVVMLVAVSVVALSLASAGLLWVQKDLLLHEEHEESEIMADLVASMVAIPLQQHDLVGLKQIMGSIKVHDNVIAINIFDNQRNTLAAYEHKQEIADGETLENEKVIVLNGKAIGNIQVIQGMTAINVELAKIYKLIGLMILGVLMIIACMAWLVQKWLSKPLILLSDEMLHIQQSGDYSIRISEDGHDEITQLAESFNNLLVCIEQRDAQLSQSHGDLEELVKSRTLELHEKIKSLKRTEQNLEKVMHAMERAGEAVLIMDAKGHAEYVNPAFIRVTGYQLTDLEQQAQAGIVVAGVVEASMLDDIQHTALKDDVWEGRLSCQCKNGESYSAMVCLAAIYDEHKQVTHYVSILRDMTEEEYLQEQLRHSQKMEAVGVLVGGIAHDFNNLLAGIVGSLELAKVDIDEPEKALAWLDDIESISHRAAETIAKLLAFARKDQVNMKTLSLNDFMSDMERMAKVAIREDVDLSFHASEENVWIHADANQLQQVLLNLLNNAVDAMDEARQAKITVTLACVDGSEVFYGKHPQVKKGRFVCIAVRDNGCGFDTSIKEKIFEPFFTTKQVGKGTGLGLSMAYGIIERHGGALEVSSTLGVGTEFSIYLPCVEVQAMEPVNEIRQELSHGHGQWVLLADDEKIVRDMGQRLLERLEYHVLVAEDGLKALDMFKQHQDKIALVILDLVMPRMGGSVAAKHMRALQEDLPIMFVTGYDLNSTLVDVKGIKGIEILSKPYRVDEFSQIVRRMIEGNSA